MFDACARTVVETLARTWRLSVSGDDQVRALREGGTRLAFAVWHSMLLVPLWHRRHEGITLLVSQHRDAQRLADAGHHWGYHVVRGSSTRGGVMGTKGMLRALQSGFDIATTPDGPRGPARIAKPGIAWAAAREGATVIPIGFGASSAWHLSSWDRFRIPKYRARVHLHYGKPLEFETRDPVGVADTMSRALNEAENTAACNV